MALMVQFCQSLPPAQFRETNKSSAAAHFEFGRVHNFSNFSRTLPARSGSSPYEDTCRWLCGFSLLVGFAHVQSLAAAVQTLDIYNALIMNVLLPDQEKQWLLEVAQGDEMAFAKIFEYYHHSLGRHIYAITKSEQVAEEIVQDTFLKIWMSRETLAEIKNFKAYLFTVSRNAAISELRKALKQQASRSEWEQAALSPEPDEWMDREAQLSIIDEAIEALHPQRKKVFVLFRQKGWTCEQVAQELGISPLTVRSHIQQATTAITRYVKSRVNVPVVLAWIISQIF